MTGGQKENDTPPPLGGGGGVTKASFWATLVGPWSDLGRAMFFEKKNACSRKKRKPAQDSKNQGSVPKLMAQVTMLQIETPTPNPKRPHWQALLEEGLPENNPRHP